MNNSERENVVDLRALSSLLDEALDLTPDDRGAWLERLPDAAQKYHDRLQEMLVRSEGGTAQGLITHLPPMQLTPNPNADQELAPDDLVGAYRLLRVIGRGGMGTVWLAERADGSLRRQVALKLPLVNMSHKMLVQRFERERDILSGLEHPNIARLYDTGFSANGQPYLAMEYVQGEDLTHYCDERRLSLQDRLELFRQVLDAVQYAHANLVVHRDLKPANILVSADGRVHLLDFGVAKLLAADDVSPESPGDAITKVVGMALTPEYASPEQFLNEPVSIASDVYSLGVLLYELLSGERPYQVRTRSRAVLEAALLSDQRTAPSAMLTEQASQQRGGKLKVLVRRLRGDLDNIILKALKARPGDRYATVNAFAEDLQRWRAGEPVQARADSRWYRMQCFVARNKLAFAAGITVVASLSVGLATALWQARIAQTESRAALATEAFLISLFRANSVEQDDPVRAQRTTARELLDRGSQRITDALDDAPEAKLRVLKTLTNLNDDLSLVEPSFSLQAQRLALVRRLHPGPSSELAAELIDTAFSAIATSSAIARAPAMIEEAEQMLDSLNDTVSPIRGRLELAKAFQLESDNCTAAEHAQKGVTLIGSAQPSEALVDGLLLMAENLSFCGQASKALAAGQEALQTMGIMGRRAKLDQAHAAMSLAYTALGQLDKGIASARLALDAAQAKRSPDEPPDSGTLNAAANLAIKLVGFAHPMDALAITQPIVTKALANISHVDPDGLVSVLVQHALAKKSVGEGAAAIASIDQAIGLLATFDAEDGQRVMVLDAQAEILTDQGQFARAEQALAQAAVLHAKLHHTGTGQANSHITRRVTFQLRQGNPAQAKRELEAFVAAAVKPGVTTRPQTERVVLQAEIALARRDWPEAVSLAQEAQSIAARVPMPLYARDLQARAGTVQGLALDSLGKKDEARQALQNAKAIKTAMRTSSAPP